MARKSSAATPAIAVLEQAGVSFTQHRYDHDPGAPYGLEAAERLDLEPGAVFKTLLADVDGRLVVGIVPVTRKLDLKAVAGAIGGKRASMADPVMAERSTGYVLGGISPLGQRKRLPTVIDASAEGRPTIFVSGGRRGLELALSPADLIRLLSAAVADIARD